MLAGVLQLSTATAELDAVPVCLLSQLWPVGEPLPSGRQQVASWASLRWTKTALLAIEHVNSLDCSVLGPGCESLLEVVVQDESGLYDATGAVEQQQQPREYVRIEPYLSHLRSLSSVGIPDATQACLNTGSPLLLGAMDSEQTRLSTAFVSGSGETNSLQWGLIKRVGIIPVPLNFLYLRFFSCFQTSHQPTSY
jgi:hypothetical protein